ncbi:MAG: type II toxin-antitoxin system RelE/ParE family toxin [Nitrospira sp.]|nr:type II toxin-antitoxin system RelE/ParE family toxin [Nitrospira sp.]
MTVARERSVVDSYTQLTYSYLVQTVIETDAYLSDAKRAGLSEQERMSIVEYLAKDPQAGDDIQGTGGARKIRFAGKGKGKRGGYRVITFFSGTDIPVFLLNVFAKNERVDLTQVERNEFKATLGALAAAYRRKRAR